MSLKEQFGLSGKQIAMIVAGYFLLVGLALAAATWVVANVWQWVVG